MFSYIFFKNKGKTQACQQTYFSANTRRNMLRLFCCINADHKQYQ